MAKYIVRYEKLYSTVIEATSEQEALSLARREEFNLDETTDYEAELEEPRDPPGWEGGFAENH